MRGSGARSWGVVAGGAALAWVVAVAPAQAGPPTDPPAGSRAPTIAEDDEPPAPAAPRRAIARADEREASIRLRALFAACAREREADTDAAAVAGACEPVVELLRELVVAIEADRAGPLAEPSCAVEAEPSPACRLRTGIARRARCLATLAQGGECPSAGHSAADFEAESAELIQDLNAFYAYRQGQVSLVLRGGLSLGNYQAGVAYYLTEFMKARHEARAGANEAEALDRVPARGFASVTGASAGGINAFIAAIEPWRRRRVDPERSDYFIGWTQVGFFARHGRPGFIPEDGHFGSARRECGTRRKGSATRCTHAPGDAPPSPLGLLSAEPLRLQAARVAREAQDGLDLAGARGSTALGINVTLLEATKSPVHYLDGASRSAAGADHRRVAVTANRQSERLLFDVRARGGAPGEAALEIGGLRPFVAAGELAEGGRSYGAVRSAYPLLGSGYASIEAVEHARFRFAEVIPVLQATSAFPLAFPPVSLTYTPITHRGAPAGEETRDFVDGGVFDNTPLGLAIEIDDWQERRRTTAAVAARRGARDCGREAGESDSFASIFCAYDHELPTTYLFIEPTVTAWETVPTGTTSAPPGAGCRDCRKLLPTELRFVATFAGTSAGAALLSTSEHEPFVIESGSALQSRRRLVTPPRHMEITGARLGNFMAFFEQDFRIFDFYVGVLDAEQFLRDDPVFALIGELPAVDTPRHACMRAYYEGLRLTAPRPIERDELPELCGRDALTTAEDRELLAGVSKLDRLEQVTIRRVREDWATSEADPLARARMQAMENRLAADNFARLIVAMHNFGQWTASPEYEESLDFERFFAELDRVGYVFVDMQHGRRLESFRLDAAQARMLIRDLMQKGVNRLARAQPEYGHRLAVGLLGTTAADFYEPRPSLWQYSLGLNFNGLETSTGLHFGAERRIRWDILGARFYRLRNELYPLHESLATDSIERASASGLLVSRLVVAPWRNAVLGLEFGVGAFADWMFTFLPRPGEGSASRRNFIGLRYGPEASFTAVLLRHVYLDLQLGVYADDCGRASQARRCQVDPAFYPTDGRSPHTTLSAPVRFSVGLGWRWTF